MKLWGLSRHQKGKRALSRPNADASEPGLYRLWMENRRHAETLLPPGRVLTMEERKAVMIWSMAFAEWGLRAVPCPPVGNTARVVEVYGPDNLVPGHIIYPAGSNGYVLEAFDGTREAVPDLGAALAVVAI